MITEGGEIQNHRFLIIVDPEYLSDMVAHSLYKLHGIMIARASVWSLAILFQYFQEY